ncbi:unnamed protein product [Urochloa decumbens]|uniref:Uncharacterized protein n=1 Tax=Urochloa decumbens TaxID=240449 RepID=A0ABC9C0I8_9POAL
MSVISLPTPPLSAPPPPPPPPPPFGPVDPTTWSDYAILDMQLAQYFKKSASEIILPMLFGFLPITLCNGTKAAIAFSVFAVISVVITIVSLLFAGKMQHDDGGANAKVAAVDGPNRRRVERLCYAAYASCISLMGTAVCLAAVINRWYWALASPLLLVAVVLLGIFLECGHRNQFAWGALQYEEHKHDLKFFFDLSSEVAQAAFAGLSGSLLGNLKKARCLQDESFGTAEGFTLYAVIVGLFLMLVCTIPPAIELRSIRDKTVAVFLKWTAYLALALISLAWLFAAATVVQTFAVLAVVLIGAMGAFWFYNVYRSKPRPVDSSQPRQPVGGCGAQQHPRRRPEVARARHAAGERSLMWLGIHSLMFGTLMASYSVFLSGQHFSGLYKAGVFFVFAVLLTNFCRMVLVREAQDKESEALVVLVTGLAIIFLVLLAVLLLILLAMLQPNQLRSTFAVA